MRDETGEWGCVEVEQGSNSCNERSCGLASKRRSIECCCLGLRDCGEVDYPRSERNLCSCAKDRRWCFRKDRIFLELHAYRSRPREQSVGSRERYSPEIVIHGVIGAAYERNSVDKQTLGVWSHLNCAEHETSCLSVSFRLVACANVVNSNRTLSRLHVLRRRRVNRVVCRIASANESISRERP